LTLFVPESSTILPQAIIFDIGRVIVRLNLDRAFAPLAAALEESGEWKGQPKRTPDQMWTAIQSDSRWGEWQEGRITPQQWHEHITERLGIRLSFADFCTAWNRVLDPRPILGDELFVRLGSSFRLALLSNTDELHVDYMERHFSFMAFFPVRIYSCRVGFTKPAPAIYQAALDALQVPAESALYIDDIPEFVEAARQLGLDAIPFKDPDQLISELSRRRIPIC
jgi:FMN phosphatase YigB (HAD superfamily)